MISVVGEFNFVVTAYIEATGKKQWFFFVINKQQKKK